MARIDSFVVGTAVVFAVVGWVAQAVFATGPTAPPQRCAKGSPCKVTVQRSWAVKSGVDHDTTILTEGVTEIVFKADGNNNFVANGVKFEDSSHFSCRADTALTTFTCTVSPNLPPGNYKYTVTLSGALSGDPWVVN